MLILLKHNVCVVYVSMVCSNLRYNKSAKGAAEYLTLVEVIR